MSAAIHQVDVIFGQRLAHMAGGLFKNGEIAGARAAKNNKCYS